MQNQVNNLVLDDLQDVDLTVNVPSNGAVLQYDSGLSQWISSLLPPSTNALSSLTDVQLGSLNNGELLTYNTTANKWVN